MGLPRTFVGFSSTDINYFWLMLAWKEHEHIDFNFTNVQFDKALASTDPAYIKRRCREQINTAGTYILIIGQDVWTKTEFVKAEVEVAIEKGCRLIGVNIDDWRFRNPATCPAFFGDVGALFVPYSPKMVAEGLRQPWNRPADADWSKHDWFFIDEVYTTRGYTLSGYTAVLPPKPPPFMIE